MKVLKAFDIAFVGLKEGYHDYSFEISESFFESFEQPEIERGKLVVDVRMEKQKRMLIFEFNIRGFVSLPCDRCLHDMDYPVEGRERLIVKFGQERVEETEEILVIPETDSKINISSFIYEYIMLLIPYKRIHKEGDPECAGEVIEKLNEHSSGGDDTHWAALKGLKDKLG